MAYHSYIYLVCTNCKRKQFIGADMEEIVNTMSTLVDGAKNTGMKGASGDFISSALIGISEHMLIGLKFLKKHFNHNIVLWNASEGEPIPFMVQTDDSSCSKYALFEDEWEINKETSKFDAPRWPSVIPVLNNHSNPNLMQEVDMWKKAYQSEYILRNSFEQIIYKKDEKRVKQLSEELKGMVSGVFSVDQNPTATDYEAAANQALAMALKNSDIKGNSAIELMIKNLKVEEEVE